MSPDIRTISRQFTVDVTKDHLVFSAGHFITIGDFCERLHGHNYRVAAQVEGTLDENGFVFDFIALRDTLQSLCDSLDHRMLLPDRHPEIRVDVQEEEIEVRYDRRRWVFPKDECVLLPVEQTTAELIAQWLGEQMLDRLKVSNLTSLTVKVEENFGQWAGCRFQLG
ncbi:6-pyruvoyl trahydropterin synthase family protein [Planctomicrobium sp. SH668]|uniref:6-pyruvoyl trahydropterin synthase family protein n=1 Tax=Planctomicrobium sp. SH668 TaxID=3448126 RepID=UPI003F5AE33C